MFANLARLALHGGVDPAGQEARHGQPELQLVAALDRCSQDEAKLSRRLERRSPLGPSEAMRTTTGPRRARPPTMYLSPTRHHKRQVELPEDLYVQPHIGHTSGCSEGTESPFQLVENSHLPLPTALEGSQPRSRAEPSRNIRNH